MSDSQAFYEFMYSTARYTEGKTSLADALNFWSEACVIFNGAHLRVESEQSKLDNVARHSPKIATYMANKQRIPAIKELRILTDCGLLEAKECIDRVYPW